MQPGGRQCCWRAGAYLAERGRAELLPALGCAPALLHDCSRQPPPPPPPLVLPTANQYNTFSECCQTSFGRTSATPLRGNGVSNTECYLAPNV
jgi:hypothetical protein